MSVKDVEPYLDGYRITFQVGNPFDATFNNLKIKTVWGLKFDSAMATNDVKYYERYNASLKRKEFLRSETLLRGSWNKLTVELSPAKAAELGFFSMSLDAEEVILSKLR